MLDSKEKLLNLHPDGNVEAFISSRKLDMMFDELKKIRKEDK